MKLTFETKWFSLRLDVTKPARIATLNASKIQSGTLRMGNIGPLAESRRKAVEVIAEDAMASQVRQMRERTGA